MHGLAQVQTQPKIALRNYQAVADQRPIGKDEDLGSLYYFTYRVLSGGLTNAAPTKFGENCFGLLNKDQSPLFVTQ